MPQELIYTSAQRGLKSGSSGFCTVAATEGIRDALLTRLEQLSYYKHLGVSGGIDRTISCHRLIEIRGERYRILSKLANTGADFSGRTNFIAHHLVFRVEEIGELAKLARRSGISIPSPSEVFLFWPGWKSRWADAPESLPQLDLESFLNCSRPLLPAKTWAEIGGDPATGWSLHDRIQKKTPINARDLNEESLLLLIAEGLQLLEEREPAKWWNASSWNHTFTTHAQGEDNLSDFDWQFVFPGTPAFAALTGRTLQELSSESDSGLSGLSQYELEFARVGITTLNPYFDSNEQKGKPGETISLTVGADGLPSAKTVNWFLNGVERIGSGFTLNWTLKIGRNRLSCKISNFRETQKIEHWIDAEPVKAVRLHGKSSKSEKISSEKIPLNEEIAWTENETSRFVEKLFELGNKNSELWRQYGTGVIIDAGIDIREPLSKRMLVERIRTCRLKPEHLDCLFKVLSFAKDTEKLALVKNVRDEFSKYEPSQIAKVLFILNRIRRRRVWKLAFICFLEILAVIGLQCYLIFCPFSSTQDGKSRADESKESPSRVSKSSGIDRDPESDGLMVFTKRNGQPGIDNDLRPPLISAVKEWHLWLRLDPSSKSPSGHEINVAELGQITNANPLMASMRDISLTSEPKAYGWQITLTNQTLKMSHTNQNRNVPEVLIFNENGIAHYFAFRKAANVDLSFDYKRPDSVPHDENTRIWMNLLRSLPQNKYSGRLREDSRRLKGAAELSRLSDLEAKLGELMRNEADSANKTLKFHRDKLLLFEQANQIWSELHDKNSNDQLILKALGAQTFWAKHSSSNMGLPQDRRKIAQDLYLMIRYLEKPRQGRPEIDSLQKHSDTEISQWLNGRAKLWQSDSNAGRFLAKWRQIEYESEFASRPKIMDYIKEWPAVSSGRLTEAHKRIGRFRKEMEEIEKDSRLTIVEAKSFELSVPSLGTFNVMIRNP